MNISTGRAALRAACVTVALCCVAPPPAFAEAGGVSDSTAPASLETIRGRVWWDADLDGLHDREETGLSNIVVSARSRSGVLATAVTARDGRFVIPVNGKADSISVDVGVPPGHFPTTHTRSRGNRPAPGAELSGCDFGLAPFRRMTLRAEPVSCLASGDLAEGDWPGPTDPRATGDADLVAGSDRATRRPLSVWLNHADAVGLFTARPDEGRASPPLLSLVMAPLNRTAAVTRRRDVVAGTSARGDANLLVWLTLAGDGGEGQLPATPTHSYLTEDRGDVQALAAWDVDDDGAMDLIAGTRSPGLDAGTLEVWRNDGAAEPKFARAQALPRGTSITEIGAVTALERVGPVGAGDGLLLAGTRTAGGRGQIVVLGRDRETRRLEIREIHDLDQGAVTAITAADFDADGEIEIVVALETGPDSGSIQVWTARHDSASTGLTLDTSRPVPFVPTRLAHADLGGTPSQDLVVAFRSAGTSDSSGVRVFTWDADGSIAGEFDPWAGRLPGTVAALATADFDGTAGSHSRARADLVLGIRSSPHEGSLLLLAR